MERTKWFLRGPNKSDEPFGSGMDALGMTSFKKHARAAAERGHTVLFSTQIVGSTTNDVREAVESSSD